MDCYSSWIQNYRDMEQEEEDYFMEKHGNEKRWYKKYGLSRNEEDNLVMDEMEREGYE